MCFKKKIAPKEKETRKKKTGYKFKERTDHKK